MSQSIDERLKFMKDVLEGAVNQRNAAQNEAAHVNAQMIQQRRRAEIAEAQVATLTKRIEALEKAATTDGTAGDAPDAGPKSEAAAHNGAGNGAAIPKKDRQAKSAPPAA